MSNNKRLLLAIVRGFAATVACMSIAFGIVFTATKIVENFGGIGLLIIGFFILVGLFSLLSYLSNK